MVLSHLQAFAISAIEAAAQSGFFRLTGRAEAGLVRAACAGVRASLRATRARCHVGAINSQAGIGRIRAIRVGAPLRANIRTRLTTKIAVYPARTADAS